MWVVCWRAHRIQRPIHPRHHTLHWQSWYVDPLPSPGRPCSMTTRGVPILITFMYDLQLFFILGRRDGAIRLVGGWRLLNQSFMQFDDSLHFD